jgi:hypothetical protein
VDKNFLQFGPFTGGIDNVNNVRSLSLDKLREAVDMDIDNTGNIYVRPSLTTVSNVASHSLWSNSAKTICLIVEGTTLRRINPDETRTTIRAGLTTGLPMAYAEINNEIYYSNGQIIEKTDGYSIVSLQSLFDSDLSTEDRPFKRSMTPGAILEFYNNRLYSVMGGRIIFSDSMHFASRDNRYCRIYVPGNITMFKPVNDGIWLSFGGRTYFMSGDDPDTFDISNEKADYGAIGQAIDISRELVGIEGLGGKTIMWMSGKGICVGADSGQTMNLSIKKYQIPAGAIEGKSFVRINNDGISHFITSVTTR